MLCIRIPIYRRALPQFPSQVFHFTALPIYTQQTPVWNCRVTPKFHTLLAACLNRPKVKFAYRSCFEISAARRDFFFLIFLSSTTPLFLLSCYRHIQKTASFLSPQLANYNKPVSVVTTADSVKTSSTIQSKHVLLTFIASLTHLKYNYTQMR